MIQEGVKNRMILFADDAGFLLHRKLEEFRTKLSRNTLENDAYKETTNVYFETFESLKKAVFKRP